MDLMQLTIPEMSLFFYNKNTILSLTFQQQIDYSFLKVRKSPYYIFPVC